MSELRLSLNQAPVRHLDLGEAVSLCQRHEIPAIGLWRDKVADHGLARSAAMVRRAGLHVSSLCRGGFFTHADPGARAAALADNRTALAEAAERAVLATRRYAKRQATWFRHHEMAPEGRTHTIYARTAGVGQFSERKMGEIFDFIQAAG